MLTVAHLILFLFCTLVFAWALDVRTPVIALLALAFALVFGAALIGLLP